MRKYVELFIGQGANGYIVPASNDETAIRVAAKRYGWNPDTLTITPAADFGGSRGYTMQFKKSGSFAGQAYVRDVK